MFYHKRGHVYGYVEYLLNEISRCLDTLVIVINGDIEEASMLKLNKYTSNIIIRENEGYDAGGYKEVLINYLGWDRIKIYDELLLLNNSFFGSFYPIEDLFKSMNCREVDFWGITRHGELFWEGKKRKAHIQSYFIVIRKEMINDKRFREFWLNLDEMKSLNNATDIFELNFTSTFEGYGYKWLPYIDTSNDESSIEFAYNPYLYNNYEMLSEKKLPFIKIKAFIMPLYGYRGICEDISRCLEFIDKHTEYDINLIWEYLLDNFNISDIYNRLHLKYILDKNIPKDKSILETGLVIVYINPGDSIKEFQNIFHNIDAIYLSNEGIIFLQMQNGGLNCKNNILTVLNKRFKSENSLLKNLIINLKIISIHYKYIGFYYDLSADIKDKLLKKKWEGLHRDNLFASENYLVNIFECFEEKEKLGLLLADTEKYKSCVKEWDYIYSDLGLLLRNTNVAIDKNKVPFSSSGMFWGRVSALLNLDVIAAKAVGDELNIWKYLLPYVAQGNGYYTATLETLEYAAMMINTKGLCQETNKKLLSNIYETISVIRKPVYIYGAGIVGSQLKEELNKKKIEIEGFIISDEQMCNCNADNIYHLSAISKQLKNAVVIVAIHSTAQQEVLKKLSDVDCYLVLSY